MLCVWSTLVEGGDGLWPEAWKTKPGKQGSLIMTGVLGSIYGCNTAGENASNVGDFQAAQSLVIAQFGCYPSRS
jgi:hypothetical protein